MGRTSPTSANTLRSKAASPSALGNRVASPASPSLSPSCAIPGEAYARATDDEPSLCPLKLVTGVDERHRDAGDALPPSDRAQPLVRGGLDAHGRREHLAQQRRHLGLVRREPGLLADHGDVDVDHGTPQPADDHAQQVDRVGVLPLRLVVGEELAEAPQCKCSEQGVDDGMGQAAGAGAPRQPAVVLDLDSTDHEALSLDEPMAVVTGSDPQRHQAPSSPALDTWPAPSRPPSGSSRRSRWSNTEMASTPRSERSSRARS